jgi:2-dehydropantoate 2-reductase
MLRLAIYGAGSLGTILGAFIAKSGIHIDLINRNVAHVQALRDQGAHITGTVNFIQPVTALTPNEMNGTYDIIFLLTKQHQNREVATFLLPFLAEDGVLVAFQNGIPEPLLAEIFGERRVLGAVVEWGAELIAPGTVVLTSPLTTSMFRIGGLGDVNHVRLKQTAELLRLMCGVTIETNFIGIRWLKLLINAAFGGMSVVLGRTLGEVIDDPRSREYVYMVMKECINTTQAAGIKMAPLEGMNIVTNNGFDDPVNKWITKHRNSRPSMLQDLEHGKKTEIDWINGVVCEWGERWGVATPYCKKIVEIVHKMEKGDGRPNIAHVNLFNELK